MLPHSESLHNPPYRIFGVDPGSVTLGVGIIDYDLRKDEVVIVHARTLDASKAIRHAPYPLLTQVHGDRFARLRAHEDALTACMSQWSPHTVISEAPYLGRFPQAFAALTEVMTAIRNAVYRYDPFMPLEIADPMTVKLAVGVGGKGKRKGQVDLSKDVVQAGLKALVGSGQVRYMASTPFLNLDEHSVDACCAALVAVSQLRAKLKA